MAGYGETHRSGAWQFRDQIGRVFELIALPVLQMVVI
jgi:hypothetical protein